ncbi:MAG: hypothetical protein K6G61_10950 [Solobacterium sp.]|nr:hypothetical protein [Solobacterium sp.]
MNIKKGISCVAFGFLFTLVNINLTLNGFTVNVMPDFIGYLLLFLAFGQFGSYAEGREFLKWCFLLLAVVTAGVWGSSILRPELAMPAWLTTAVAAVSACAMFLLFGIIEKIAGDFNSPQEQTVGWLKYVNVILYAAFFFTSVNLGRDIASGAHEAGSAFQTYLGVLASVMGAAALVFAVITAFVLFKLKKDIEMRA